MIRIKTAARLTEDAPGLILGKLDLLELWGPDGQRQAFSVDAETDTLQLDWCMDFETHLEIAGLIQDHQTADEPSILRPFLQTCELVARSGAQNVTVVDFDDIHHWRDHGETPPLYHFERDGVRAA